MTLLRSWKGLCPLHWCGLIVFINKKIVTCKNFLIRSGNLQEERKKKELYSKGPQSVQPKKAPKSPEFIDDPSKEEQKSKKTDGKKTATKARKKVKKASQPKKAPKLPESVDSSKKEEQLPKDDKEPSWLGVKEITQSFFDPGKDSKNLILEKEVERVVFMRGPYKGQELSNVVLCDTEYVKKALKRWELDNKTKSLIKQALEKA